MSTNQNSVSGTRSSRRSRTQSARARGDDPLSTLVQPHKKSDTPAAPPLPNNHPTPNPSPSQPESESPPAAVRSVSLPKKKRPTKPKNARKGRPPPSLIPTNEISPQTSPIHVPSELPASINHTPPSSHSNFPTAIVHSPASHDVEPALLDTTAVESASEDMSQSPLAMHFPVPSSPDDDEGSSNKENDPLILPQKTRQQPGRSASLNAPPIIQHHDPFDSPPSEDDYGLAKDLKRRQNANKPRPSPTTSESDIELDEEYVNETQPSPAIPPADADSSDNGSDFDFEEEFDAVLERFKKEYGCEVGDSEGGDEGDVEEGVEGDDEDLEMAGEDGDVGDRLDEDPTSQIKYKAGPLSDTAKEVADKIYKACIDGLEELARQEGKSVKSIYQHVGLNTVSPRNRNNWNIYLMHLRANHGERFKHLNRVEWTKAAQQRYKKFLAKADAGEDREKAFAPIIAWYNNRLASYVIHQNRDGKMGKLTKRLLKPFIDLAVKVYQSTGIEVFGYAVNPERDSKGGTSSVSWGGTPGFLDVRNENEPNIIKTLQDLETMFHMRKINQVSNSLKQPLISVEWAQKNNESVRDRDSRVLKEYMRKDTVMILVQGSDGSLDERAKALKSRFPWSGLLDFTYRKHVRLVGWPAGYTDNTFQIEKLPAKIRRELAQRRKDYEDGKCDETGVLRVVPWTAEEVLLSEQDLGAASTIPLIQDILGTDLRFTKHSEAYLKDVDQLNGVKSTKTKATSKLKSGSHSLATTAALSPPIPLRQAITSSLASPFTLSGDYEASSGGDRSLFGSVPPSASPRQSTFEDNDVVDDYIHMPSSSPPLGGFDDEDDQSQLISTFMSPPLPQSFRRDHNNSLVASGNPRHHSAQGATQRLSHLLSQPARVQPLPHHLASHGSNPHRSHSVHVARPQVDLNTNRSVLLPPQVHPSNTKVNPLIRSRSPTGTDDSGVHAKRQKLEHTLRSCKGSDMGSKQLRAALRAEIDRLDNASFSGAVTARPRPRPVQPASTSFTPFEAQFATPGPSQPIRTPMPVVNRNTSQRGAGPKYDVGQSKGGKTRR
ncbi:hypothetical protein BDN72DRAFT_905492 [Pluteus cervinus]|uniref:Uncharacterized protein n=1 Tax=Pluteus cervinus TaxID=181527 RepID=A0ACD3A2G1_9AGAR|nr:hypothetical protein BDN72DRAFT_905492 [Pluteus cervinus]